MNRASARPDDDAAQETRVSGRGAPPRRSPASLRPHRSGILPRRALGSRVAPDRPRDQPTLTRRADLAPRNRLRVCTAPVPPLLLPAIAGGRSPACDRAPRGRRARRRSDGDTPPAESDGASAGSEWRRPASIVTAEVQLHETSVRAAFRLAHATRRKPSTCRSHPSSRFQLAKMRVTTYPSNASNDLLPLDFALADRNRTSREFDPVQRVPVL